MSTELKDSLKAQEVRRYGKSIEHIPLPNLMELQVKAWNNFLQKDIHYAERDNTGLEAILREIEAPRPGLGVGG